MKLNSQPKVSILMGIYNCESTLSEAIESILNQTYKNCELIMCDDCSSDNTYEVAKKYANAFPNRIKLIRNNENLTLGPTLNKCLELADGKYIARQDGDDISELSRIEKQVEFLEQNNNYDLVGTGMTSFDENGNYGMRLTKEIPEAKEMVKGSTFAHATILMKTDVMKSLNGYSNDKYARQVEDYDLWFRFFEHSYRGYNLQETLYYVREDRDAYKRKNIRRRKNEIIVMCNGIKRLKLPFKYYVMLLKPIIAAIIPGKLLMKYHKRKFSIKCTE